MNSYASNKYIQKHEIIIFWSGHSFQIWKRNIDSNFWYDHKNRLHDMEEEIQSRIRKKTM